MSKEIRILAHGWYGAGNVGDELLLDLLQRWAREAGASTTVLSMCPEHTRAVHRLPTVDALDLPSVALAMQSADLFILGGGGLFQSHHAFTVPALYNFRAMDIAAYARPCLMARQMGVPTLLWAQGVGPLTTSESRAITRDLFSSATFVSLRDDDSRLLLNEVGVSRAMPVAPDPVWSYPLSDSSRESRCAAQPRIAVVLRPWSSGDGWEDRFVSAFNDLVRDWPAHLVWLPFQAFDVADRSRSDLAFVESMMRRIDARSQELCSVSCPSDAVAALSRCDGVIAMRLHAVIMALRLRKPTLSIEYAPKMATLGDEVGITSSMRVAPGAPLEDWRDSLEVFRQTVANGLGDFSLDVLSSLESASAIHREILRDAIARAVRRETPGGWCAGEFDWVGAWAENFTRGKEALREPDLVPLSRVTAEIRAAVLDRASVEAERDTAVAERNALLEQYKAVSAARDDARAELDHLTTAIKRALADRDSLEVERDAAVAERSALMDQYKGMLAARDEACAERERLAAAIELALAEKEAAVAERDRFGSEALRLRELLDAILLSYSWKITAPARFLPRLLRYGLLDSDRVWFEDRIRSVFHRLPLSGPSKDRLYHWYGRRFGYPKLPMDSNTGTIGPDLSRATVENKQHETKYSGRAYSVLCLPIIEWDFRFQRPQQIARQFARSGHPLYYVSQRFATQASTTEIESGVLGVILPGRSDTNVYKDLPTDRDCDMCAEALANLLAQTENEHCICLVQLPFWGPIAERLRIITGCYIVYDCMDEHAGFSTNGAEMLQAEERLLRQADLVIASSGKLFEKVSSVASRALLIRNGVDFDHFGSVGTFSHRSPGQLVIGYYGAIADWFDSELVSGLARLRPNWSIVLVGSTFSADLTPLRDLENVSFLGEQPYENLPELITPWDCCIIPFKRMPLTEATNPVKIYEMLAAGKPVVAVGLPELTPIAHAGLIALADTASDFVGRIEEQVQLDTVEMQTERRSFARKNTWDCRRSDLDDGIRNLFPLVSIVIVTYNNLELNRLCLASVLTDTNYPRFEVIVVDNGSADGTPDFLKSLEGGKHTPRLRIVLNERNLGFAAANNQGIAIAEGQYLCLLNNDTVVCAGWLSRMVFHLQQDSRIGLIGPVTNAIANEAQIPVDYADIRDMRSWAVERSRSHRGKLADIPMLAFFCVLMPRSVYKRVGPLDERFGIGMFEDDDYNDRVRTAGFQVKLALDSFVHHWQRASFKLLGESEYMGIYRDNERRYRAKTAKAAHGAKTQTMLSELMHRCETAPIVIVFPPSVGWNISLFQRPHHLARALAARGALIVFDCSGSTADNFEVLQEVEKGIFLFREHPSLLNSIPRLVLWTFSYNFAYRDHFRDDVRVIYDWIDDLTVFPYDQVLLRGLHQRALREADAVFSVAQVLHARLIDSRRDAVYLPNAVDAAHFSSQAEPSPARDDPAMSAVLGAGRRIAGYYGALAEWFDYGLLMEVAEMRSDWCFLLIGPDLDGSLHRSGIAEIANVHWIGPRPYADLPGYLKLFDIALIPFRINEITLATSPLKLFEYFAGRKPVLATPMPECASFPEVQIAATARVFAASLDAVADMSQDSTFLDRLAELAGENSWEARARIALDALGSLSTRMINPVSDAPKGAECEEVTRSGPVMTGAGAIPTTQGDAPSAVYFADWDFLHAFCNVCGRHGRFFFQDPRLFREQLVCEHCRSTSRYRSIARGLLLALRDFAGVDVDSLAALPGSSSQNRVRILDTQTPFHYEPCAYHIPEYLAQCEWVGLELSTYRSGLPLGESLDDGVTNQNLEQLTYADESFDIVITSDVLEHVRLDDEAHREIARVLVASGVYLFTVPHNWEWERNLVRVDVVDSRCPELDVYRLDPEYHGDANSPGGVGVLAYRAYGRELEQQLQSVGLSLHYEKQDFPQLAIMGSELFYCRKTDFNDAIFSSGVSENAHAI